MIRANTTDDTSQALINLTFQEKVLQETNQSIL